MQNLIIRTYVMEVHYNIYIEEEGRRYLYVSHGRHTSNIIYSPQVHVDTLGPEPETTVDGHTVNTHEASLVHARPDVAIIGELGVAVCTTARGEAERVPRDEQFT